MAVVFDSDTEYHYDPENPWYKRVGLSISDFRNWNNKFYTISLFAETVTGSALKEGFDPIFTLKEFDYLWKKTKDSEPKLLYSLPKLYIGHRDPYEYNFSMSVFGSHTHWLAIARTVEQKNSPKPLKNCILTMRADLEQALRSEGLISLRNKAALGDTQAAKFLASKEWHKEYINPGRPTRDQLKGEKKVQDREDKELDQIFERAIGPAQGDTLQ